MLTNGVRKHRANVAYIQYRFSMVNSIDLPNALREDLAHTLGFPNYPQDLTAEPYLSYITNRYLGKGSLDGYFQLLIGIIRYFEGQAVFRAPSSPPRTLQGLIDLLIVSDNEPQFTDSQPGSESRKEDVEDTVMYTIGLWTMLSSSFV